MNVARHWYGSHRPAPGAWLDRLARRHHRSEEWRGLLEIEAAHSAPERRLLLAREFRRLADEVLASPPDDSARWPSSGRLTALRRQARLLVASAADHSVDFLPDQVPADSLTPDALSHAARCLANYLTLLQTVRPLDTCDAELLRVITREHTRVSLAYEDILQRLSDSSGVR